MIKKQLSILAGSVLLASGANAAITNSVGDAGSSVLAVLVGTNGSYVFDAGISAEDLASGTGFSLDVSSAAGIGTINSFAVFGITGATNPDGAVNAYADIGYGVVSAGASNTSQDATGVANGAQQVRTYIAAVGAGGFQADGSGGDLDSATASSFWSLLQASGSVAGVTWTRENASNGVDSTLVEITSPSGSGGVSYDGTTLSASAVPVPAAAWLFGSALLGLGVVRRKQS